MVDLFELADYVAFAIALAVGIGIGKAMERRKKPKPLTATCESCLHGYGYHEGGKACSEKTLGGDRCRCKAYIGPDPLMFGIGG